MANHETYNPLAKINLARSIENEILTRPATSLADTASQPGAGIYAIYYSGEYPPYASIADSNRTPNFTQPIYVGKAIPKGGRKGRLTDLRASGRSLTDRLAQHASSIKEADNLSIDKFNVRQLVVDDIWISLGENMLIERFRPLWNQAIDGFGNKDPGNRRATQFKSPWDVLHPGRRFADKLAEGPLTTDFLLGRIDDFIAGRTLRPLPKVVAQQQVAERLLAEED